jgi:hypothetical protein
MNIMNKKDIINAIGNGSTLLSNQQLAGVLPRSKQEVRSLSSSQVLDSMDNDTNSTDRINVLLSREEVANRWSCCPHTIARRKDLKPLRLGRRLVRYRLSDVEAIEMAAVGK